jgi:aspartyl/glutamyl-tRNA(Asn/Gln) amidotransferase, C subunit
VSITREDVLHIAQLARLGVDEDRVAALTRELAAILAHMEVLSQVDISSVSPTAGVGAGGTPLRPDVGVPLIMLGTLESFAPSMRDGFFMVPRLTTHEDPIEDGE